MDAALAQLTEALRRSQHTVVLTGAGVSAESGLSTFRDPQDGLWSQYRPEDLATPEAFARDPQTVWRWYEWRRAKLRTVQPNAGHHALAELQSIMPAFTLITQNVDGLHQQAGSTDVIEFHGNITRSICANKPCSGQMHADDTREPPHCPQCNSPLRPDVVWFGEPIPNEAMQQSLKALQTCDLFIAIGTSAVVYPAAGMAQQVAYQGACVVEINPNATPLTSSADIVIPANSGAALTEIVERLTHARTEHKI
jgi:NAD-dependent deacetylase